MNTKDHCIARCMMYEEKGSIIAVCLDFNIIQEHRNIEEAIKDITGAVVCHFEAVVKNKLPDHHLNKAIDEKYLKKWDSCVNNMKVYTEKGHISRKKKKEDVSVMALPLPSYNLVCA